ncbi:alpha/beta hydrolase fold protein, partial [Tanacetum coccineum]
VPKSLDCQIGADILLNIASQEAARRAESLPIFLCHGQVNDVLEYKLGEKSAKTIYSAGFQNLTFRSYIG